MPNEEHRGKPAPENFRFLALMRGEAEELETVLANEIADLLAEDEEAGRTEMDDMTKTLSRIHNRVTRIIAKFDAQP